jgi:catechol 2,3-dioxygenase
LAANCARVDVTMRFPNTKAAKEEMSTTCGKVAPASATEARALSEPSLNAKIGHVHLRVADLEHSAKFYREVLGFEITFYGPTIGLSAVFLAAGDYHHHIALNTFHGAGSTPPPPGHTGLHHFAILYADEIALARAAARVLKRGYPIEDARDHGGTFSIYLRDIDGNGIELYYDRPRSEWFDTHGRPVIKSESFDVYKWLEGFEGI